VELIRAAGVSSHSLTRVSLTLLVLMLEGSLSHGVPLGWTTGAGTWRITGETAIQVNVLPRHFWAEIGGAVGHQALDVLS